MKASLLNKQGAAVVQPISGIPTWNEYIAWTYGGALDGETRLVSSILMQPVKRLDEYVLAEAQEVYASVIDKLESLRFPLDVYRGVRLVGGIEGLSTDRIGNSWSWEERCAKAINPQRFDKPKNAPTDEFVLHGKIASDAVDWGMTVAWALEMTFDEEREVRLNTGATVKLLGYRKADEKEWTKLQPRTVTAAGDAMPTRAFKALWHVGTLDPAAKRHDSHEGAGLSVSTEPQAWEQINPLTSGPTWELTKPGNRFLNFHRLTKPQRKTIREWGVEQGYATVQSTFRVSWWDPDEEETRYFTFSTRKEAEEEIGDPSEEYYEDGRTIEEVPGSVVATDKLRQRSQTRGAEAMVEDILATFYAEDVLHLDGVWWADRLNVASYSAPRGVIFNAMLPTWTKLQTKAAPRSTTFGPVYHGTNAEFSAEQIQPGPSGLIWFSTDREFAAQWGKNIIEATLTIRKPYVFSDGGLHMAGLDEPKEVTRMAKQYDGIIVENPSDPTLPTNYAVFSPYNVKGTPASRKTGAWQGNGRRGELGFMQDNPAVRYPEDREAGETWLSGHPRTITGWYESVMVPPKELVKLPGARNEHLDPDLALVDKLTQSMQHSGFREGDRPLVIVEQNGQPKIYEGNHRVRAALAAGLEEIPVTVRYFGGSEDIPGVWDPATFSGVVKAAATNAVGCDWAHPKATTVVIDELDSAFPDFGTLLWQFLEGAQGKNPYTGDTDDHTEEILTDIPINVRLIPISEALSHIAGWGMAGDDGDDRGAPHIAALVEAMKSGHHLPPAVLDYKGRVIDGRHRIYAADELGVKQIPAIDITSCYPTPKKAAATKRTAREKEIENEDHTDEDGFWAGAGNAASGILPIAADTHRICLAWRSAEVHQGDCWGTIGGAVKSGLSPEESAKAEMKEEVGYGGGVTMHKAWVFESGEFSYHNFIGVVPNEFAFSPKSEHAWETDFIEWRELDEIHADMEKTPEDYHPELINLFEESRKLIEQLVGARGKKASASDVTATPGFKAWFSGSKVVNPDGSPMVMYHGTMDDIDTFQRYTHFGDASAAKVRLNFKKHQREINTGHIPGARTMPVYLSIKNPVEMSDQQANDDAVLNRDTKNADLYAAQPFLKQLAEAWGPMEPSIEALKRLGYDGIRYRNHFEGGTSWINFHPSQVKSAIGNSGAFNPEELSIAAAKTAVSATYNTEAYKQTQREYEGPFKANMSEEDYNAYFHRGHEWQQSILAALSTGQLKAEDCGDKGSISSSGVKATDFKPLPSPLYHVTTAATKVRQDGLLSRWEIDLGAGAGLGGGDDMSISFTADRKIAEDIYDAMICAQEVASGKLAISEMIAKAEQGAGAKRPYINDFWKCWDSTVGGDRDIWLAGQVSDTCIGHAPSKGEGWKADPSGYHWTGGDGVERYSTWMRPRTAEEDQRATWQCMKAFLRAREYAEGPIDPLFFMTDTKKLAQVPKEDIAILTYQPKPGAMGAQVRALGEWRTYSGAAVQRVKEEQPKVAAANVRIDPRLMEEVERFRSEQEAEEEWELHPTCFTDQCLGLSTLLAKRLCAKGFAARPYHGTYTDDLGEKHNHWWAMVGPTILDVANDQFHPGEEVDYRVVVSEAGDPRYSVMPEKKPKVASVKPEKLQPRDIDDAPKGAAKSSSTAGRTGFPTFEECWARVADGRLDLDADYEWWEEIAQKQTPGFSQLSEEAQEAHVLAVGKEKVAADYKKRKRFFESLPEPMVLYRAVGLSGGIEQLELDGIGDSWTWDEKAAVNFLRSEESWILKASVPSSSVDWEQTMLLVLSNLGDSEKEIRLLAGASLELLAHRNQNVISWTPFRKHVTAAAPVNFTVMDLKSGPKTASPDFGYTNYNDRDEALSQLHWTVHQVGSLDSPRAFTISVIDPSKWEKFESGGGEYYRSAKMVCEKFDHESGHVLPSPRNPEAAGTDTDTWTDYAVADAQMYDPQWKGTGLGQMLYEKAIEKAKSLGAHYFYSDKTRTPDAEKAWRRLRQRYNVQQAHGRYYIDLLATTSWPKAAAASPEKVEAAKHLEVTVSGGVKEFMVNAMNDRDQEVGTLRAVRFNPDRPDAIEDPEATMALHVPELKTRQDVVQLMKESDSKKLFVRSSSGPTYDMKQPRSRDYQTNRFHGGLSALRIDPSWLEEGVGYSLVRLTEYANRPPIKGKRQRLWIYEGNEVGTDSDGHESIQIIRTVAVLSDSLVKSAQRFLLEDRIASSKDRLSRITDPSARQIAEKSLLKAQAELERLPATYTTARKVASPDFGYSQHTDRDAELSRLVWKEYTREEDMVTIRAYLPTETDFSDDPPKGRVNWLASISIASGGGGGGMYVVSAGLVDETDTYWRGTGLGQMLYDKAIAKAKSIGAQRLYAGAWTTPDAKRAWDRLAKRYTVKVDETLRGKTRYVDLTASKVASSDFGYSRYNEAEEDIKALKFRTGPYHRGFEIGAQFKSSVAGKIQCDRIDLRKVVRVAKGSFASAFLQKHAATLDSHAFETWFHGSKVVDGKGNPRKVYHGTDHHFSEFKVEGNGGKTDGAGAFFTSDSGNASAYGKTVMSVYLKITHPLEVRCNNKGWDRLSPKMDTNKGNLFEWMEIAASDDIDFITSDDVARYARATGLFDGVIFYKMKDQGPRGEAFASQDVFVIFNPDQAKTVEQVEGLPNDTYDLENLGQKRLFDRPTTEEEATRDGIKVSRIEFRGALLQKNAGMGKNPPGKPEANYVEETNGWALFPDQREGAYEVNDLSKMIAK